MRRPSSAVADRSRPCSRMIEDRTLRFRSRAVVDALLTAGVESMRPVLREAGYGEESRPPGPEGLRGPGVLPGDPGGPLETAPGNRTLPGVQSTGARRCRREAPWPRRSITA